MAYGAALGREARFLLAGARTQAVLLGLLSAAASFAVTLLEWSADRLLGILPLFSAGRINTSAAAFAAAALFWALSVLALSPLSYGITRWCVRLCGGKRASAFWFFGSPRRYARSVCLGILLALRRAAALAAAAALPAGLWFCADAFAAPGSAPDPPALGLRVCAAALAPLTGFFCLLFLQRYALAAAALGMSEDCTARGALRRSARAMRGREGELLRVRLSLWRTALSQLLVLPIPRAILLRRTVLALYARERLSQR